MSAQSPADPLAALSGAAAEFLGPIAGLLVQRLAGQTGSFIKLREALALQIENPRDRERFRQKTQPLLGSGWLASTLTKAAPAQPAARPESTALPNRGLARREPQLLLELTDELLPCLGHHAARIVNEQSNGCSSRVQLFLKLAKIVPDEKQRRALEARALSDHRQRLS